ncbi:hypothetical protein PoB_005510800 [Plakobranchus ocellatus]|uniref:Uncharacterized protein n=1 Tax=Plakobranchus ocellatus TaxID=259542 RepID=A0AAV4CCA7_9GAST|nr:hypothetical protein PoB_005510800 [Plakobranchus ocellatus]
MYVDSRVQSYLRPHLQPSKANNIISANMRLFLIFGITSSGAWRQPGCVCSALDLARARQMKQSRSLYNCSVPTDAWRQGGKETG